MKTGIIEELTLFGESSNQNYYHSEKWGLLKFFTSKDKRRCLKCLLFMDEECNAAPCRPDERKDGHSGYFSIHEYPRPKF